MKSARACTALRQVAERGGFGARYGTTTTRSTRRQLRARSPRTRASESMRLAAVAVAVDGEQHLRLDLAEAVEHALHAEIGRAGRPDRAEAGGREHRDDRLRHVRHEAGDAVAGRRPARAAPARARDTSVVELGVAEPRA